MKRIHFLLTAQTVIVLFLTLNRLGSWTLGYAAENQFLRWVDFHNMLTLPLLTLVCFYLLKKTIEYDSPQRNGRTHLLIGLFFVIGVYLLGAGYGDHEVTNYLHVRFCADEGGINNQTLPKALCRIVIFNDDEFSHWLWFAGFVFMNVTMMLLQVLFPHQGTISTADSTLLIFNGLFIGLGIFANLAFEVIGLDLSIIALIALLAVGLLWRVGRQPLLIYYNIAYLFGLLATAAYKAFRF